MLRTLDNGVADVEVVVVLVPAHLGHQDGQVVVGAALDRDAEAAVALTLQVHRANLKSEKRSMKSALKVRKLEIFRGQV